MKNKCPRRIATGKEEGASHLARRGRNAGAFLNSERKLPVSEAEESLGSRKKILQFE